MLCRAGSTYFQLLCTLQRHDRAANLGLQLLFNNPACCYRCSTTRASIASYSGNGGVHRALYSLFCINRVTPHAGIPAHDQALRKVGRAYKVGGFSPINGALSLVDPAMGENPPADVMEPLIKLGIDCCEQYPEDRPLFAHEKGRTNCVEVLNKVWRSM